MSTKKNDGRGKAGADALKKNAKNIVRINKKKLLDALNKFRDERIPIIKTELAEISGLSESTLNRSPYKEIIKEYADEEKVLLSPNAKQEFAELIRENLRLKEEIKWWEEKYNRLRKEITYTKELFG